MTRVRRRLLSAMVATVAAAALAAPAAAHPLGNATVSRGVAVTVASDAVEIDYVVDMAEIPAFAAIGVIDADRDGTVGTDEAAAFAGASCTEALTGLVLEVDGGALALAAESDPVLSFPPGVGGLETLRLECSATAQLARPVEGERHTLRVTDRREDGRPGWRELTISAGPGIALLESDVPATSPSAGLTMYPEDLLAAPIDVRAGTAIFAAGQATSAPAYVAATAPPPASDPLVAVLATQIGGGPMGILVVVLVSAALGAAHALSPGHGKALVAAALVGSHGTARQAFMLGLTVAASHSAGVLVLGALVLGAGAALAPDRLLAWMSLVAGGCVIAVGAALMARAALRPRHDDHGHPHSHPHSGASHEPRALGAGTVVGLGLFGGLVPSSSAVIVLLLAVTTGQLLLGLAVIAAFGIGMAGVLSGFALLSIWLGSRMIAASAAARRPALARIGAAIPFVSSVAVVAAGVLMTMGALTQVL